MCIADILGSIKPREWFGNKSRTISAALMCLNGHSAQEILLDNSQTAPQVLLKPNGKEIGGSYISGFCTRCVWHIVLFGVFFTRRTGLLAVPTNYDPSRFINIMELCRNILQPHPRSLCCGPFGKSSDGAKLLVHSDDL